MNILQAWGKLTEGQISIIERHQKVMPVKVGLLAEELGITVKSATLEAGISGEIKLVDDTPVIRVNRHDVKARQRFTLAHEIAHFLLHKDKIGDGIVDDILYRSNLSDALEAEANRLAADILMPLDVIKAHMLKNTHLRVEEQIESLADELQVSITAIKIRLGKG